MPDEEWEEDDHPIVVIGSAALDAKVYTPHQLNATASVPGQIRLTLGGVARNIAESLARFECSASLITAVGQDSIGDYSLDYTARTGVNVDHALRVGGEFTGAYLALLGEDGRHTGSVSDMGVLTALTPDVIEERRDVLENARTVILDNNLPLDTLTTIISICQDAGVSVCADPTSAFLAPRLIPFLPYFNLITPNQHEAAILCGQPINSVDDALKAARLLVAQGLKMALVTLGSAGVVYATANERGHVAAPRIEVVDLTGGSDAMTAAVVYALINDIPVDEAVRLGMTAAILTIASTDTVRQDLSLELLYASMVA